MRAIRPPPQPGKSKLVMTLVLAGAVVVLSTVIIGALG